MIISLLSRIWTSFYHHQLRGAFLIKAPLTCHFFCLGIQICHCFQLYRILVSIRSQLLKIVGHLITDCLLEFLIKSSAVFVFRLQKPVDLLDLTILA